MKFGTYTISIFDLLILLVLVAGAFHGRKRGMSLEFIDVVQWPLLLLFAGNTYEPIANFVAPYIQVKILYLYIGSYLLAAGFVALIFHSIKKTKDGKILGPDFFGSMEYYLGTVSGAFRYGCILVMIFSVLNIFPVKDRSSRGASNNTVMDVLKSRSPAEIHYALTRGSNTGRFVRRHFSFLLMHPAGGDKSPEPAKGKKKNKKINITPGK